MKVNSTKAGITLAKQLDDSLLNYTITCNIKRIFTDVNGVIVNKNTVPIALQTKYPVFTLGEYDRMGGYKQGLAQCPPMAGTYYLASGVIGANGFTTASVIGFTGLNQIRGETEVGDIVHVFTDDIQAPTYYIWVIQTTGKTAIGSIIGNTKTTRRDDVYNRMWINKIIYTTSNVNVDQWKELMVETRLNNLGLARADSFSPIGEYRTPYTYLNNILIMVLEFYVDQFIGYNTYIQFATEQIQLIYHIKK